MPWFESSKEKQLRKIIEDKMAICLTRPQRYEDALKILDSYTKSSNQKVIEMIVDHVKQTIKDDDIEPMRKYQSLVMLRDLMKSRNKALGKYVVKKILKRLTILAQHNKSSKNDNRGTNIFPKTKKNQQQYGAKFLTTLLLALEDWGKNWPKTIDGPFKDFQQAYNSLTMANVSFPKEKPKNVTGSLPKHQVIPSPRNSKPTIENQPKRKSFESKPSQLNPQIRSYLQNLTQRLKVMANILNENIEMNQMWAVTKQIVGLIRQQIQKGDGVMTLLLSENQEQSEIFKKIQENGDFLQQLEKDVTIVDKKNQKYPKFRTKYIKRCNIRIAAYEIYFSSKSNSELRNNESREASRSASNNKPKEEEKQQKSIPKIRQKTNRYDSTSNLQEQLQKAHININKADFASNSHNSDHQSRYGSVGGRNRLSVEPGKSDKEEQQSAQQKQQPKQDPIIEAKLEQSVQKKRGKQQMSKISEKMIESEQGFGGFGESKLKIDSPQDNSGFNDFSITKQKEEENSNSDFFKELDKNAGQKNNGLQNEQNKMIQRRPRNKIPKKVEENFFDNSLNQKGSNSHFSAFDSNSRSKSNKKNQGSREISGNQASQKQITAQDFETFENKNIIKQKMDKLKEEQDSNPFASKIIPGQQNSYTSKNADQQNPFQTKIHNENPFASRVETQNPFATNLNNSNPFNSKIEIDNQSKSSNPFSKENSKHEQSVQHGQNFNFDQMLNISKNSQKSLSNPFDANEMVSKKSVYSKGSNPFDASVIQNPFDTTIQKQIQNDRSISKNKSFEQAKVKIEHNTGNLGDDPFQINNEKLPSEIIEKQGEKKPEKFLRESIQAGGFDFEDFGNISQQSSNQEKIRQSWEFQKPKQEENLAKRSSNPFANEDFFENQDQGQQQPSKPSSESPREQPKQVFDFDDFGLQKSKQWSQKSDSNKFFDSQFIPNKQQQKDKSMQHQGFSQFDFQKEKSKLSESKSSIKNPFEGFKQSVKSQKSKTDNKQMLDWDNFGEQFNDPNQNVKFEQSKYEPSEPRQSRAQLSPSKQNVIDPDQNSWWGQKQKKEEVSIQNIPHFQDQRSGDHPSQNIYTVSQEIQNKTLKQADFHQQYEQQHPMKNTQITPILPQISSPFQKKQIPWSHQISYQISGSNTNRYNEVHLQDQLKAKKQHYKRVCDENKNKLSYFNSLKMKLSEYRDQYQKNLKTVQQAKEQRNQYKKMLTQLQESNQSKERDVQDLIKRIKQAEQLKYQIIEKQKLLYQYVQQQKRVMQSYGKPNNHRQDQSINKVNKFQKFNNNLKRLKEQQLNQQKKRNEGYRMAIEKRQSQLNDYSRNYQESIYLN